MLGEELVKHLGQDLMGGQGGVFIVADDHSGDPLGASVDVEGEICEKSKRGQG